MIIGAAQTGAAQTGTIQTRAIQASAIQIGALQTGVIQASAIQTSAIQMATGQDGAAALILRDLHHGVAPSWWPPAPGWLVVAALVLLLIIAYGGWLLRRRRRQRAMMRVFDQTLAATTTPVAELAAISELLRRAARLHDPDADRLQGEDWLRFLDAGLPHPVFVAGPGHLLTEGLFRPAVAEDDLRRLREVARARFLSWMGAAR